MGRLVRPGVLFLLAMSVGSASGAPEGAPVPPAAPSAPSGPTAPAVEAPPGAASLSDGDAAAEAKRKAAARRSRAPGRSSEEVLGATPPTLTLPALRNELGGRGGSGTPVPPSGLEEERARLQALAEEIARAREALREDTARLEALLQRQGEGGGTGGAAAGRSAPSPSSSPSLGGQVAEPFDLGRSAAGGDPTKEQIDLVSKAMKGMKPEQAAPIISRLDRALAAEILRRMRPADAGAILGRLKPEVAADLATEMAVRPPRSFRGQGGPGGRP